MKINDCFIGFLSLFNYPHISEKLLNDIKGPILLHISDTPDDIYNYIFRLINILKPQFVIHTGDLADNIKLGNNINFDIDLKCMYTENEKEMILDAISRFGDEKVSVIKKVMPDYVKYESIRAVILERYLNKICN